MVYNKFKLDRRSRMGLHKIVKPGPQDFGLLHSGLELGFGMSYLKVKKKF